MFFKKNNRKFRIIYTTGKTLTDGDIYVVHAKDKDEFDVLLQEIKEAKYTVLDKEEL